MRKLKKHPNRITIKHKRFPHDLTIKRGDEVMACKYCRRTPLVKGFDLVRTIDGIDEAACIECYKANRTTESSRDGLARLGMALAGLQMEEEFPLSPEEGTPEIEEVGKCATCREPIYYNNRKQELIDAYNELLRGIRVHEKCGIPLGKQGRKKDWASLST